MSFATLLTERRGSTAIVTLNRPDRRNALSPALVADLDQAVRELAADATVRTIILTGAGAAFSAGADLATLQAIAARSYQENRADSGRLAELFDRIQRSPKPVIAAVNGPAVAGGCGLATIADLTIASEAAFFCYSEVRIGFIAAIVMVSLCRIVGDKRARDLLLTGRKLAPHEALQMGLVNEVVPAAELVPRCLALADELAKGSPASLALTKEMLVDLPGKSTADALGYAADMNARTRATADCQEGIAAFLEKRPPRWQS
ncbi:MAG: enoyl-CoA hydratase-related protein [Planctomycetota bacterium]